MVGFHLRWDPLGTWVLLAIRGQRKGGGKGKDCRAPQDNSAEHEKSVSTGLHRGEKKLYVGEGLFTKSVDIFNIVQ
jgi:hypothetical protein